MREMTDGPIAAELATGNEAMDGEHRMQVSLIAALRAAVADGRPAPEVDEILDRLLEFTKVHFSSEELLMRFYSYDGYEAHVLEHEGAVERMERIRDQYRAGETALTLESVDSLGRWIVSHTHRADRAFGGFLGEMGAGQVLAGMLESRLPVGFLPALVFIVGASGAADQ